MTSRLGHCDFAFGALRLGLGHSGRGAFRQWGIAIIIPQAQLKIVEPKN